MSTREELREKVIGKPENYQTRAMYDAFAEIFDRGYDFGYREGYDSGYLDSSHDE